MQPLFSNALSGAVENHVKLPDTRRETPARTALLIMRQGRVLLVAAGGSCRKPGATGVRAAAVPSIFPACQTGRRGGRVRGRRLPSAYPRRGQSSPPQILLKQAPSPPSSCPRNSPSTH
ncbi:MAG: hypothetical protein WBG11_02050 [Methylocella sp.]